MSRDKHQNSFRALGNLQKGWITKHSDDADLKSKLVMSLPVAKIGRIALP
jgi:hypothetical protein